MTQTYRLLREPLLHFVVLGALLFALYAFVADDGIRGTDAIVIDEARVAALASRFERVWQRSPTPDEMSRLVDEWIREEILYREGVALGLDRNDPILRQRVAQKMEFLAENMIDPAPAEAELRAWFEANAADYRHKPRFSFRQFYFDPSVHGEALQATIEKALDTARKGQTPDSDPLPLPAVIEDADLVEARGLFGDQFAESLPDLPIGEWVGPLSSGYGVHLVRVDERQEARQPTFDDVRTVVEQDYLVNRRGNIRDSHYDQLRERYVVRFESGLALAGQGKARTRVQ